MPASRSRTTATDVAGLLRARMVKELSAPLVALFRVNNLPIPVTEYRFHPTRRWRYDYAWPDRLIAVEIEGGVWRNGRHTRGLGFLGDMEKYNTGVKLGWRILRYTPQNMAEALNDVRGLL